MGDTVSEIWADSKTGNDVLQAIALLFPAIFYSYDVQEDRFSVIGGLLIEKLGYTFDDFKSKISETMPMACDIDQSQLKEEFLKSVFLKKGELHSCQARFADKRGELHAFNITILVSRREESGKADKLLGIACSELYGAINETAADRKELEMKLEKLARSNSELEEFTFVAAHDLQEPLRKLMTFGNSLKIGSQNQLDKAKY
jgi:hypothetical protein